VFENSLSAAFRDNFSLRGEAPATRNRRITLGGADAAEQKIGRNAAEMEFSNTPWQNSIGGHGSHKNKS